MQTSRCPSPQAGSSNQCAKRSVERIVITQPTSTSSNMCSSEYKRGVTGMKGRLSSENRPPIINSGQLFNPFMTLTLKTCAFQTKNNQGGGLSSPLAQNFFRLEQTKRYPGTRPQSPRIVPQRLTSPQVSQFAPLVPLNALKKGKSRNHKTD